LLCGATTAHGVVASLLSLSLSLFLPEVLRIEVVLSNVVPCGENDTFDGVFSRFLDVAIVVSIRSLLVHFFSTKLACFIFLWHCQIGPYALVDHCIDCSSEKC